mgnify:CR=1 FL=1
MMIYFEDEDVISSEMLDMMNKAALACLLQEGIDTDRTELNYQIGRASCRERV